MREIKFRAWDENKKMTYFELSFDVIKDGINRSCYLREAIRKGCHYELMQYTGLKDRNGKEIYEGDIIQYRDYSGPVPITPGSKFPTTKSIVNSPENMFEGILLKGNGYGEPKDIEVIGNIYENPELIEG